MLIVPPDMFITLVGRVEVKPKEGEVPQLTMQMFTVPADWVYVTALVEVRRPATFMVPPSIVKTAPAPAPITLVPTVPMLNAPAVNLSWPLLVGEPFCPAMVALALFSQMPP